MKQKNLICRKAILCLDQPETFCRLKPLHCLLINNHLCIDSISSKKLYLRLSHAVALWSRLRRMRLTNQTELNRDLHLGLSFYIFGTYKLHWVSFQRLKSSQAFPINLSLFLGCKYNQIIQFSEDMFIIVAKPNILILRPWPWKCFHVKCLNYPDQFVLLIFSYS